MTETVATDRPLVASPVSRQRARKPATVSASALQATAALSGKCCNRWNSGPGQTSNPRFRPMPPKPPGWKKTCLQVGGPSLKTWGRFGLLDRGRRPCTSAALLPRRRS